MTSSKGPICFYQTPFEGHNFFWLKKSTLIEIQNTQLEKQRWALIRKITRTRWGIWRRGYRRRWRTRRHWGPLFLWRRKRFVGLWSSQQCPWKLREASETEPSLLFFLPPRFLAKSARKEKRCCCVVFYYFPLVNTPTPQSPQSPLLFHKFIYKLYKLIL